MKFNSHNTYFCRIKLKHDKMDALFLIFWIFVHATDASLSPVKEQCVTSGLCYSLYRSPSPITWSAAQTNCSGHGRRLASIPDATTHAIMGRLAEGRTGVAWVGGRWSTDTRWRTITGLVYRRGGE